MASEEGPPSDRTRLRRKADRGHYDKDTVHAILDEGFVCHVGVVAEGQPLVLPMAYGRIGDVLYLHGATANHALRLAEGAALCVTVTLVDAVVLARSAFHHSLNYRSVVLYAEASTVEDLDERRAGLLAIVDHVVPSRSSATRPPSDEELRATRLVRIAIDEASAKIRTGGPIDEPEDLELEVWAGQLPLSIRPGTPLVEPGVPARLEVPEHVSAYTRPGWQR